MATWVVANLSYSKVLLEVAPLEKQLDGLTRSLADSQARLGACQQELAELDEQVSGDDGECRHVMIHVDIGRG
jgi:hypothetical protein